MSPVGQCEWPGVMWPLALGVALGWGPQFVTLFSFQADGSLRPNSF